MKKSHKGCNTLTMPRQNHHDFHIWHASDLSKSTAAMNTSSHSPRMQSSNDCSTSSGLEIQKRHSWEPDWTPPILKYALARITNVGNFGLYSPSGFKIQHTIAVYARWVPRFRHLRNPHETCTQTDWTLWHENFDQHQIARISQCSTGLQVQINIHKNEHIWLSAMTVPHSDSKRRICRQKNMQRPIAAGRTTSVIMLGIKLATNHAEAKHCTTEALFCWKLLN